MNLRLFHPSALISIICGVLVFLLFRFFIASDPEVRDKGSLTPDSAITEFGTSNSGAGLAILAFDESQDDRFISESLARGGIEGIISESSQLVPVDNFGELKMIPLDSYRNEIEAFDPRDDGYALKLSTFFVHDGKRFFFFPINNISVNKSASLKKQLAPFLGEIPFSLEIVGYSRPLFWYFALLAAACAAALYFSNSKRLYIFGLPVLLAFGWIGSSAFVLAAVLSGIWELLREPVQELSRPAPRLLTYTGSAFAGLRERFKSFRVNLLLILLSLIFLVVYSIIKELPPIPLIAGFGFFFLLCFLAFRAEAKRARHNRHILFAPVPLLPLRVRTFSLFPFLSPFCAAAVLALVLPAVFPALSPYGDEISVLSSGRNNNDPLLPDPGFLINAEEYQRHIDFQKSFSYRSLDLIQGQAASSMAGQEIPETEDYLRYFLGEDGLIAGGMNYSVRNGEELTPETPQEYPGETLLFPLEKLMEYLLHYNKLAGAESGIMKEAPDVSSAVMIKEWISVAIILAVCLLDLFRPGLRGRKMKKMPIFWDRRIAA